MTPDVVVDVGNSRVKWGRVADGQVVEMAAFPHDDAIGWKRQAEEWGHNRALNWAVAGVHPVQVDRVGDWVRARGDVVEVVESPSLLGLNLPKNFHADGLLPEPEMIGVDRLLTAIAARSRTPAGVACVAITIGTAMTVDLVRTDGGFAGGAILPGPTMMAKALSTHTAKLPWVDATADLPEFQPGRNTKEAIELGIAAAVVGAADHLAGEWSRLYPEPFWVYVTGGAASYLAGHTFPSRPQRVVYDRALTLDGLRLAAEALP